MDVKGGDDKVVTWITLGGGPNNLYRLGFTRDSLILVEGYQAKDGSNRAGGKNVTSHRKCVTGQRIGGRS